MKLSDLPVDGLKAIFDGPFSFLILALYKCGDPLLNYKLVNGGVTDLQLRPLSTCIAPKWPGVIKNLKLISLSIISEHDLGNSSMIRRELEKSHKGLRKLIFATESAADVFFSDQLDDQENNDDCDDSLPPRQSNHICNYVVQGLCNIGAVFPHLEELSINHSRNDSFAILPLSIELLPPNLTFLAINSPSVHYDKLPRGLKQLHIRLYGGAPSLSLSALLCLPPSIETIDQPLDSDCYQYLLTEEGQALFPNLELTEAQRTVNSYFFNLGQAFITQLIKKERKVCFQHCSWSLAQSMFPLPPLTHLEIRIPFATEEYEDATNIVTLSLQSHPLPSSLISLSVPALNWNEIYHHYHKDGSKYSTIDPITTSTSSTATTANATTFSKSTFSSSSSASTATGTVSSLLPPGLTFLELFCDNFFTAEYFHLLPRRLKHLEVHTADMLAEDHDTPYNVMLGRLEKGLDVIDALEGSNSPKYPLVENPLLSSFAVNLLANHPTDASIWSDIVEQSGYGINSKLQGPFSRDNLKAIEKGLHLGLPLSLTHLKLAPLCKAASFVIPPFTTTIDCSEQVFASPELLLRTLPPTVHDLDAIGPDKRHLATMLEWRSMEAHCGLWMKNLVTLFLFNANVPIAPTIYKHLPRTLQYFGTSERTATDAKYFKELPPQLRAFTFNGAPVVAGEEANWTMNLPRSLTSLSLPMTIMDASVIKGLPRCLERLRVESFLGLRTTHIALDLPSTIRHIVGKLLALLDYHSLQRVGATDALLDFSSFAGGGILSWDLFLILRPFMPKAGPLSLNALNELAKRLIPGMSQAQRNRLHSHFEQLVDE